MDASMDASRENEYANIQNYLRGITSAIQRLEPLKIEAFRRRIANLENNLESFNDCQVRGGLVGITSSGKSSLLNVLLGTGQRILKEQSKATTNIIVFCSKSSQPFLEINFEGSKKVIRHGQDVFIESLWRYTSEDENPQNRLGVRFIKLGLPTFLAGEQIQLADTPGLDAYGLKEHEDLTLREFLPQADLIIYLTPIGSPMKDADRRVLNQIMDAEQRVIFVQTCKGSVVEQSYGDGTVVSVESQLQRFKEDFRDSLQPYSKIKDAPIVQIETTEVFNFIKDRDEQVWRQSGLWEFLETLRHVKEEIISDYTFKKLRRLHDEAGSLKVLIDNTLNSNRSSHQRNSIEYLNHLKEHYEKIKTDADNTLREWLKATDYSALFATFSGGTGQ